jgi:SM-20-related protein
MVLRHCSDQPFSLETIFESLIDSFIENKVGLADHFLSVSLAAQLKEKLMSLYASQQMQSAGIGNNALLLHDKLVRSDVIYWLDPAHDDPYENLFFELMDGFIRHLNSTCYTGITGYEFHYALYAKGSFYKKHLDQFRNDKSRVFSMIMYLNAAWQEHDGGELCVYHPDHVQVIEPRNGKCVFFKSNEMEHEVLLTQQPRLSITGWLKSNGS